jgi:hypothetical protein
MPLPESPHMLACHQKHKHIECRDGDKQLSKHLQDPCSLETNNNQTNKFSHKPLPEGSDGLLVIGYFCQDAYMTLKIILPVTSNSL